MNMKMEIDNKDGGWKQNFKQIMTQTVTIDEQAEMHLIKANESAPYLYKIGTDSFGFYDIMPIHTLMSQSTELLNFNQIATAYKPVSVGIGFSYSRIPKAGEVFGILKAYFDTSETYENRNFLYYNSTPMSWTMAHNGLKQYKMNFSKMNVGPVDSDWKGIEAGDTITMPPTYLKLNGEVPIIEEDSFDVVLGYVHIYYKVQLRIPDLKYDRTQVSRVMETIYKIDKSQEPYQVVTQILNDPVYKMYAKMRDKQEIQELIKQGKSKEEAIQLVRRWDLLKDEDWIE